MHVSLLRALPIEIQRAIEEMVYEQRKPKRVLTDVLKNDITTYAYLSDVLYLYAMWTDKTNHNHEAHLEFMENDMLLLLNDGVAICNAIRPDLQRVFPSMSHMSVILRIAADANDHPNHLALIKKYWRFLSPVKRFTLRKNICKAVLVYASPNA